MQPRQRSPGAQDGEQRGAMRPYGLPERRRQGLPPPLDLETPLFCTRRRTPRSRRVWASSGKVRASVIELKLDGHPVAEGAGFTIHDVYRDRES